MGDKFIVHVTRNKKAHHVGTYPTVELALEAYTVAQQEAAGDFTHRPNVFTN